MLFGPCSESRGELLTDTPSFLDLYEVTVLVASAFLVNYITSDAKTNWVRQSYANQLSRQLIHT